MRERIKRPIVRNINEKFEVDKDNSHHIDQSDVVDFSVIYTSPETNWSWSYDFPDTVYSENIGFT